MDRHAPLWRLLPGSWPVKPAVCLILMVDVGAVCFTWLFPAVAPLVPFNDNTVQTGQHFPAPVTSAP